MAVYRKNNWDGVVAAIVQLKRCGYSELWECSGAVQWTTRLGEEGIWCTVGLSTYKLYFTVQGNAEVGGREVGCGEQ